MEEVSWLRVPCPRWFWLVSSWHKSCQHKDIGGAHQMLGQEPLKEEQTENCLMELCFMWWVKEREIYDQNWILLKKNLRREKSLGYAREIEHWGKNDKEVFTAWFWNWLYNLQCMSSVLASMMNGEFKSWKGLRDSSYSTLLFLYWRKAGRFIESCSRADMVIPFFWWCFIPEWSFHKCFWEISWKRTLSVGGGTTNSVLDPRGMDWGSQEGACYGQWVRHAQQSKSEHTLKGACLVSVLLKHQDRIRC